MGRHARSSAGGEVVSIPITNTDDLSKAIKEFEAALPGWWYSMGVCSVSRHASCGPCYGADDAALLEEKEFDDGFHEDLIDGTLAEALRAVMQMGVDASRAMIEAAPGVKP